MVNEKQIYSAEILHKSQDLVTAVYIQEFFKFCGICTRIREADTGKKRHFNWDKVVILNNCTEITEENMCAVNGQKKEAVLEAARALNGDIFVKLAKIFIDNEYAKVNYRLHCFIKQMNREELLESAWSYYKSFNELRGLEDTINQDKISSSAESHVLYALLTCARKVNIICRQRGNLLYFNEEKMISDATKFEAIDPEFFMGNAVLALICFQDPKRWNDGIEAIKKAIYIGEEHGNYISFLRYLYAHFLEEQMNNREMAQEEYEKILEFHDSYYRALYKQAYFLWRDREYQSAFNIFLKLTEQLEIKWKSGWIQPVEIEYLYKGCMFLEHISEELEMRSGIPAYVFEIISDKNELFGHSKFVKAVWENHLGDNADYFEKKLAKYHV